MYFIFVCQVCFNNNEQLAIGDIPVAIIFLAIGL